MEQALGHVAYTKNLQTAFADGRRIAPVWLPVPFSGGPLDRIGNWAVRGSLRAQNVLRQHGGPGRFDALFYNTQTVSLLSPLAARRTPLILSLDATPLNFDSVGVAYDHHARANSRAERVKQALYRRVFHSASALTTWSEWAKNSLRDDYGVDPDLVTVVPPGTDLELFPFGTEARAVEPGRKVRLLFVGGDFERKGGHDLLAAMHTGLAETCELDVVTKAPVPEMPAVRVHSDLGPNDPRLVALYRDADVFVLPTYADCLAVVLGEAMAASLPIVTTNVAAQPEAVRDGVSGMIIQPGDVDALGRALRTLAGDAELRRRMGREGRAIAEARFDTRKNAERLARVIEDGIARRRVTNFAPALT
jgi:glycosyltransferase involved in cell wall biosynthesis